MADVTIRDARPSDLPVLKELSIAFEAWLDSLEGEPGDPDPVRADALGPLAFGRHHLCDILVAEVDGTVVGHLVYYFGVWVGDTIAPCLHVADLFVRETHQRQGIGRALMDRARTIAQQRGAQHLFWTVWRKNPAGQEFYRRIGAEPFDEEIFMRWRATPD
jgi:GNAT superfamily N-acetyltransferase